MEDFMSARALVPETLSTLDIEDSWVANVVVILSGTFLLALAAQIQIPLPGTLVPLTGQTFAVLLIGATLGSWRAVLSTVTYLLAGGFGLPFFAGGGFG